MLGLYRRENPVTGQSTTLAFETGLDQKKIWLNGHKFIAVATLNWCNDMNIPGMVAVADPDRLLPVDMKNAPVDWMRLSPGQRVTLKFDGGVVTHTLAFADSLEQATNILHSFKTSILQ